MSGSDQRISHTRPLSGTSRGRSSSLICMLVRAMYTLSVCGEGEMVIVLPGQSCVGLVIVHHAYIISSLQLLQLYNIHH